MAAKPTCFKARLRTSTLSLFFLSITLLLFIFNLRSRSPLNVEVRRLASEYPEELTLPPVAEQPRWYNLAAEGVKKGKVKIGLVNMEEGLGLYSGLHGLAELITVDFDRVDGGRRWEDFFPEWIDEEEKWGRPTCPKIPVAEEKFGGFDVVVARVPCDGGARDVSRLQVNLVVADLTVRSGWERGGGVDRTVHVVFVGSCGPMWEIFRCDDLIYHEGDQWVYTPDLRRLKQKLLMPVGSCQLAPPYAVPVKDERTYSRQWQNKTPTHPRREAYVTVLHASEAYVCGAIALAQSILRTNSTRDLLLLADRSISPTSLRGLRAAGWKIRRVNRIRSPRAAKDAYNEWNYTKLRIWQLTNYDKIIFIDSDLVVLRKMDHFFVYPQISAAGNDGYIFNSGVMLVEPSECTFKTLMKKRFEVGSYNGGDQGFLNEMFPWWHRWPTKANRLKVFDGVEEGRRDVPEDVFAVHYLGLKPWLCYMDYDCNWDMVERRRFASDAVHRRWWEVYNAMPRRLQSYCALTESMEKRIRKWRGRARAANFPDGHWKTKVKDPRRLHS